MHSKSSHTLIKSIAVVIILYFDPILQSSESIPLGLPAFNIIMALIASLEVLVILVIFQQLEYFSISGVLKVLPTMLRRKLLVKYLPVADILLLESANVTDDLDMNQVWKELVQDRLRDLISASKDFQRNMEAYNGRWRDFYLSAVWNQVPCQLDKLITDNPMLGNSNYLKDLNRYRSGVVGYIILIECNKTKLLDYLFGISCQKIPGTRSSTALHKLYCVYCLSCKQYRTLIPQRYLLHYAERSNRFHLLYYLSMFWVYAKYPPAQITTNQQYLKIDARGLADTILSRYPDILSLPLSSVQSFSLNPVYKKVTELHAITALCTGRSLHSLTFDLRNDDWGQVPSTDSLPSMTQKLTILNKLYRQEDKNVFIEQVVSHYAANNLTELISDGFPLIINTSEALIYAVRGLFTKKSFKALRLIDAELSFEVMNEIMADFLSSKYEQELELNKLRVYQYTDQPPVIMVGSEGRYTREKSLVLTDMYVTNEGFAELGQCLFETLRALPLKRLTVTLDILPILNNCDSIPVSEFVVKVNKFEEKCNNRLLKDVVNKNGIENVTMEVLLDEWVKQIHLQTSQQVAKSVMEDVMMAMEMAANGGQLKRVRFNSKNRELRILGSANPLSLPKGTLSLVFNRIFRFPNLHCLAIDLSKFTITPSLIQIIIGAWSAEANGTQIKEILIELNEQIKESIPNLTEQLQKMCSDF